MFLSNIFMARLTWNVHFFGNTEHNRESNKLASFIVLLMNKHAQTLHFVNGLKSSLPIDFAFQIGL